MNEKTLKFKAWIVSIDAFRGLGSLFASNIRDFIQAIAAMMVMWLIMYWMYLKKTFKTIDTSFNLTT